VTVLEVASKGCGHTRYAETSMMGEKPSTYSVVTYVYHSNPKDPHVCIVWASYGGCKSLACLGQKKVLISGV